MKDENTFKPEEYLFRKFARLYSEKFGRIPKRGDKIDNLSFEIFMLGWDACKLSIIKPLNVENCASCSASLKPVYIEEKDAVLCFECAADYEKSQREDLTRF